MSPTQNFTPQVITSPARRARPCDAGLRVLIGVKHIAVGEPLLDATYVCAVACRRGRKMRAIWRPTSAAERRPGRYQLGTLLSCDSSALR